jgi:serine/threonine protein kinase
MADGDSAHTASSSALETGVQIGDFRIERRLGAGGMGIVYQARQLSLNRPVALKVLGQALTRSTDVSRFQREAQAAARLKHASIAQVYFIGQDRHVCYLAMELIEGVSLRRLLDKLGIAASGATSLDAIVREDLAEAPSAAAVRFDSPTEGLAPRGEAAELPAAEPANPCLSPQARELRTSAGYIRRATEVIRDAARALAHAHEQGVIHRDIKPDNLLLDREGKVHLIDFGVARFFEDQSITYTGQLVGTPLYMSPEQVTGRGTIDARSDIYSLGLVLYELLTLRPPIAAANRESVLRTIITKPLPPVTWRNAGLPADLERAVHRATQKDPDQRYATAAEFADDLDRFLAGKPPLAPPYRYRLDEREIIANRPGRITLAAFIFFVCSFFVFAVMGSFSLFVGTMMTAIPSDMRGSSDNEWTLGEVAWTFMILTTQLAAGIVLGWGLLAGRTWARWLAVTAAVFAIVGLLAIGGIAVTATTAAQRIDLAKVEDALRKMPEDKRPRTGPYTPEESVRMIPRAALAILALTALPISLGIVFGGTVLWSLLSRRSAHWFRFAREIRLEHRRLKEQLAE